MKRKYLIVGALLLSASTAVAVTPFLRVNGLDFSDGSSIGVSSAGRAKIRYNSGTNQIQQSLNGAAYTTFGGSTGNWSFSGNEASLTASAAQVIGGTNTSEVDFKIGSTSVRGKIQTNDSDGIGIIDGGGSSKLLLSTNSGTCVKYGGSVSTCVGNQITSTDSVGTYLLQSGRHTFTGFSTTFQDGNSKTHFGVDAYGLPSLGSYVEWREDWRWTGGLNTATGGTITNSGNAWSLTVSGSPTGITAVSPVTGSPAGQGVVLNPSTVNANAIHLAMVANLMRVDQLTNLYAVFEWDAIMSQSGANNATYAMGIANGNLNSVAHPRGWYFSKTSAQTVWHCITDDGTTTNDQASAITTDTSIHAYRVEWYGSATTLGAKTVKFYIDGAQACSTTTTNVDPGANSVGWEFAVKNTNTSTSPTMTLGPLRTIYNRVATPLVP